MKIDQILKQPEGKTLEFKRGLSSSRNVLKTLVAFANAAGGRQGLVEPVIEEIATGVRLRVRLARPHAAGQPASAPAREPSGEQDDMSRLEPRLAARGELLLPNRLSVKRAWPASSATPRYKVNCTSKSAACWTKA